MRIKSLSLRSFRNYHQLDLEFKQGLTIITGENAQGKTNLLEAIFLLSMAKSHRTHNDSELIRWGEEFAHISGVVENRHYEFPLEIHMSNKGKIAKYNHLEQAKLSQFIGKLNVILFAPEDLQLVKGSPSLRRRFMNSELGQSHPVYLQSLMTYERTLKQRNTYLKDYGFKDEFDPVYFEIITEQLIKSAIEIIQYRQAFISRLNEIVKSIHLDLSDQRDQLRIEYQASSSRLDYQDLESLSEQYQELFGQAIERERRQGTTVYGPHRDDLIFWINDKDARNFASQGQQRSIVLSIKLAEIEYLKEITGDYPVLLLDDVLSELDDNRQLILMQHIESRVQTFLTTASLKGIDLDQLQQSQIIYVSKGTVQETTK